MYIVGASTLGEMIVDVIARTGGEVVGFYDDVSKAAEFAGKPILGSIHDMRENAEVMTHGVFVAIGDNHNRRMIFERIAETGVPMPNILDPSAVMENSALIGSGNLLMAGVYLGTRVHIGSGNLIFPGVSITHHNRVGDFNFFSPNGSVGGYTCIEDECKIAMNCSVAPYRRISTGTSSPPCTVVTGDPLSAGKE